MSSGKSTTDKSGKGTKKGLFSKFRPKVVRETGPPQRQQQPTSSQPWPTSSRPREDPPSTIPLQNNPPPSSSQHTPPTIPSGVPNTPTYGYFYAPMPPSDMSFPSMYENVYRPTFPDQQETRTYYDAQQFEQANPQLCQQFEPFIHPALMRSSSSSHSQRDIGSSSHQQGQGQQTGEPAQQQWPQRSSTSQPQLLNAGNVQESETSSGDDEEDGQHSNVRNVRNPLDEESLAASDDTCFVPEEARIKAGRIMPRGFR